MRHECESTQPSPFNAPSHHVVMADSNNPAVASLIGIVTSIIHSQKNTSSSFRIADMNLGSANFTSNTVDAIRETCGEQANVQVSGTTTNESAIANMREWLSAKNALGELHNEDASTSPANRLRNRLNCSGGADMVLFAHGAYPANLSTSKLPRMVDRLGDVAADHGVVLTLHNHGPSDADEICQHVFDMPMRSSAGLNCNTQHKLEKSFQDAKLYAFSVTIPNATEFPANAQAFDAVFNQSNAGLSAKDQKDTIAIQERLAKMLGGEKNLKAAISAMDEDAQSQASQYFKRRITASKSESNTLAITVGGGQMIMAFRSKNIAQQAFDEISKSCENMHPPAIALPITRSLMPNFDKSAAHAQWTEKLSAIGIAKPPQVCQLELDHQR
ncbi:MAG: hypothetical protein MK052_10760 [Alphaproteobacteria bacterium]|nr:hypothetical protein [Alphaproteobacteria bacterium]